MNSYFAVALYTKYFASCMVSVSFPLSTMDDNQKADSGILWT